MDDDQCDEWLQKAASNDCIVACLELAIKKLDASPSEGHQWLEKAASANNHDACVLYAERIIDGKVNGKTTDEAMYYYEKAISKEDGKEEVSARVLLAERLLRGNGIAKDPAKGLRLLEAAAAQNVEPALVMQHRLYARGLGIVVKDSAKAFNILKKAAEELQSEGAMIGLGIAYRFGEGVDVHSTEAIRWFDRVAKSKDDALASQALYEIAELYLEGGQDNRIRKDKRIAMTWFEKSARKGNGKAANELGNIYQDDGDSEKSSQWYNEAKRLGVMPGWRKGRLSRENADYFFRSFESMKNSRDSQERNTKEKTSDFSVNRNSRAGDLLTLNITGIQVRCRWCPAGSFKMGSPSSEKGRSDDENQVSVTLTSGFWLMETECSQELWTAVMGSGKASEWTDGRGDKYPVYNVSYNEVQEFAKKLTKVLQESGELESGVTFRLPTEAEWEYGVRAGTTTAYCFGDDPKRLGEYAWYDENSNYSMHPVGTKKPNAWGIHDGHGSVVEWVNDYYKSTLTGGINPTGPSSGSIRVQRGGATGSAASLCRSASRRKHLPTHYGYILGFRLALSPAKSESASQNESKDQ